MPMPEEARRLAETVRKREYRAAKHSELVRLEAQARRLGAYLALLKREIGVRQLARAKDDNLSLRTQVNQYNYLMQIFSQWVRINEHPQKDFSHRPPWMESTLLAHPITRQQGIQWLSERVYYQARRAVPLATDIACTIPLWQPYSGQIEMVASFNTHLSDGIDDEGVNITGFQTRYRHTLPTDFRSAAALYWERVVQTNSTVTTKLIERVDDRFVYCHYINHRIDTHLLSVAGIFHEDNRVVVTHCYVTNDELLPLEDGVVRHHGFSWTMYEAVSSGITRVHSSSMHYTPITTGGRVIPLERIGQLFGQSPSGVHHRDAYIERIRSAAEASFIDAFNAFAREKSTRENER
ncbi:hypothetical protein AC1031_014387 [Aphanomyces cochlioides]|nr:hypothetical protein AC1031_014387 [Aphanomyces cochlioides]